MTSLVKFVAIPGDGCPGEVEGVALSIGNYLDDVGIEEGLDVANRKGQGCHPHLPMFSQIPRDLIHQGRWHAGLIALKIDDQGIVGPATGGDDLGKTIGSTAVIGAGHDYLGAKGPSSVGDPRIVSRD